MLVDSWKLLQIVSRNVKRERALRGWSQQDLADRSKVSRGMIVKIESGEENVSLATLGRIALAFGIAFTEVVTDTGLAEPRPQVWQGTCPGTRVALLDSFVSTRMTDVFEWTLAPGDRHCAEPDQKGSREMVYIVQGELTLEHQDGTRVLAAGASLAFPSDRACAFVNAGTEALRFLLLVVS